MWTVWCLYLHCDDAIQGWKGGGNLIGREEGGKSGLGSVYHRMLPSESRKKYLIVSC